MAKTNSQRQADWKLKNLEKAKIQNAQKNKIYRHRLKSNMTEEQKKMQREKEAKRKRCLRFKKNTENIVQTSKKAVFATPQLKGKLMKRTRDTLKGTPAQNFNVLKHLIEEYSYANVSLNSTNKFLPQSTVETVKSYYFSDKISRASPNVKDYVIVKENNQRKKLSVKHLLYSVKEIYAMFIKENPEVKVSVSKFFQLRPTNVVSFTKMPHNVCCCQIHENVRCALKVLQKVHLTFKDVHVDFGMHKNFVCDNPTENCFMDVCFACKNGAKFKKLASQMENHSQVVKWSKWVKIEKKNKKTKNYESEPDDNVKQYCNIEKVSDTGTIANLLKELYERIPEFLDHENIKLNQAELVSKLIEIAEKPGSNIVVILIDFAESFKCFQQNAPQSAHYGQTPITVFTIAVYHRLFKPMAIASDYEKHFKECILAYIDVIIDQLPETVKKIFIWSDNPSSQFKNKYIMEGMKSLQNRRNKIITWNFYAAMHGKSVVDGIGAKRYVHDRIVSEDLMVKSAEDFVSAASTMNVKVILMKKSDVEARNKLIGLDKIVKDSKKIVGISKYHYFEVQKVKTKNQIIEKVVGFKITPALILENLN